MKSTPRRRSLLIVLLLVAILFPIFQGTTVVLSTGFRELGFPPIARIDYIVTDDMERIPQEPRLRYGFFFTVGLVSVLCFAAGRLSHATFPRNPNVA